MLRVFFGNLKITVAVTGMLVCSVAFGVTKLAQVGDKVITDKDLLMALGSLNEGQRKNVLKDSNSKRQVLSSVIEQELLALEAEKLNLDKDEEYKDAVAAFRKQYLANKVIQKNLSSKFTESAAKKYYEKHKQKFSTDMVHAQHILVADEEKAKELMKKAKEPGVDFQELAEKNSRDPSAKNNRGDLGFFGRDRMVPAFTEAAFGTKEGEIVGPIKTDYGYHIIKVIEKRPGQPMEYDEVELKVKAALRQDLVQEYLGKLKQTAKIQVNNQELDKL